MKNILFFISVLICVIIPSAFSQETITITTYYPAPFGVYQELRANRMAIGDNYSQNTFCWPPAACANQIDANADLVVEGNVGIGTTTPFSEVFNATGPTVPLPTGALEVNGYLKAGGPIFPSGGDFGPNSVYGNIYRSTINRCPAGSACSSAGLLQGDYLIISGWTNPLAGPLLPTTNTKRVIGLFDDVIIPFGNLGIGTPAATPQARLDVAGGIKIANDARGCGGAGGASAGTLRYNNNRLELCNGAAWVAVGTGLGARNCGWYGRGVPTAPCGHFTDDCWCPAGFYQAGFDLCGGVMTVTCFCCQP